MLNFFKYKKKKFKFLSVFLNICMVASWFIFSPQNVYAQSDTNNGDWSAENVIMQNTSEGDLMVRAGDIDNFGYGWPINFNPFSGNSTPAHKYPFYPTNNDPNGLDTILTTSCPNHKLSNSYKGPYNGYNNNAGVDGYSQYGTSAKGEFIKLNYINNINNINTTTAVLQIFVDDFQPGMASGNPSNIQYQFTIRDETGKLTDVRIPEIESVINSLDQSGPIGKLITVNIPTRFIQYIRNGSFSINIDDPVDAPNKGRDGYAIDFVKLIINPKGQLSQSGTIKGKVSDYNNNTGISGATVSACAGLVSTTTDSSGNYTLNNVPAGLVAVDVQKSGYAEQIVNTDLIAGQTVTLNFSLKSTIPPPAPVITTPKDGTITNNNKQTITGTGQNGATVVVYDNGNSNVIGTTSVDQNGNWSLIPINPLVDGKHAITAIQKDAVGNISANSNTVNLTIDTIAPGAPVITVPADKTITNNNKPTISGTGEKGATVTVYDTDGTTVIGTAKVDNNGNWSLTPSKALSDGPHAITAKQVDAAGNVSGVSNTVNLTIDTIAPGAPVITVPADKTITNNNKPTISGTGEKGATVTVYDTDGTTVIGTAKVDNNGNWSLTPSKALSDGPHAITAKQVDAAGNVSGVSNTVNLTIDTIVPAAPVITAPADGTTTSNNKPAISGTGEKGATVTVYDGTTSIGTAVVDSNGTWSLTPGTALVNGNHAIAATQSDAVGNASDKSNTVNLKIVPAAPVITAPADGTTTSNNKPAISGTGEKGATVTVYDGTTSIGTAVVDSNGTWSLIPGTELVNGNHAITATQNDAVGNVSAVSNTVNLTIDTAPSSIVKQGIYMSNNANNEYISTNSNNEFDVVKTIPVNVAMIVDVESFNPQISLKIDGNLKNTSIIFNKYKVTKDSTTNKYAIVSDSLQSYTPSSYSQEITFTNNMNNSNFSLVKGSQYIIFYSLTPKGNKGDEITISAVADSTNPAPPIKLNVQDLPVLQ